VFFAGMNCNPYRKVTCAMMFATRNEIEYLSSIDKQSGEDPALIDEMWHRLDALRCYDQNISASDWGPHGGDASRRRNLRCK
jgi:hypothetical protein